MGLGYLQIQAHTGDDALPVEGATVLIRDYTGKILYQLTTDNSGATQTISLYAPDKFHTLSPTDSGPFYSTYQVEVIHPKFITQIINNVQIYDTIKAIIPVAMLPLPAGETNLINVINIQPPAVQQSIPRNQQGPLPSPLLREQGNPLPSPFALREVVIPDYITVHLGSPSVPARNVRVKFSDYIKNVASSEI